MSNNLTNTKQIVEVSLGWLESVSLLSGIASVVISGVAMWLSITFYKMSTRSSKELSNSSSNINNNVEKLEKMFDTMYSDTFGIVKDTVIYMQDQVSKNVSNELFREEVENKLKQSVAQHLNNFSDENLSKKEAEKLIFRMLNESKAIEKEVKEKEVEEKVKETLIKKGQQSYNDLKKEVFGDNPNEAENSLFFNAMYEMAERGIIDNIFIVKDLTHGTKIISNVPIKMLKSW